MLINKYIPIILIANILIITLTYAIFAQLGIIITFPNESNLVSWDSVWYEEIKDWGYVYRHQQMTNMAFFPFFPMFWKISNFSAIQMSLFNMVIFTISFTLLMGTGKHKIMHLLVLSSLPCFIFFFLPYSEAFFFLFGTLLLMGYNKGSTALILIGILGCCLTRAVATVFIPLLIVTEIICWHRDSCSLTQLFKRILLYSSIAVSSILIVVLMQWVQTGKWFYYLEAISYWNRQWIIPKLPFSTISPEKVLGIDAVAWTVGVIAAYFSIKRGFAFLQRLGIFKISQNKIQSVSRSECFSALFLSAVLVVDSFFTFNINNGGNLWSINRHLLCTPFAVYFLYWFLVKYKVKPIDFYFIIAIVALSLFVTGIFRYQYHVFFFLVFFFSLIISRFIPKLYWGLYPLYIINIILFVIFYQDFLSIRWVG
jgi:hypothetical protein